MEENSENIEYVGVSEFASRKGVTLRAVQSAIVSGRIEVDKFEGTRKLLDFKKQSKNWDDSEDKTHQTRIYDTGEDSDDIPGNMSALNVAKLRKERAVAKLKEMEALQKAGDLIDIKKAKDIIERAVKRARDRIRNIPQKVAAELAAENDPHYIEIKLLEEIDECLGNLKDIKIN